MKAKYPAIVILIIIPYCCGCSPMRGASKKLQERQLTFEPRNHYLDNNDNFSPDDKWLVYDTREKVPGPPVSEIGANQNIEKVNVETGKIVVLYETRQQSLYGPGVGAASYHPKENKVLFIHGLGNSNKSRPYWFWRRTGVMVDESRPGKPIFIDARDVTYPFTPGALRGGTHRHEWSRDGKWIGYTYNDAIMAEIEARTGKHINLRTIGVSRDLGPVDVDEDREGENVEGIWFSALVVRVTPEPKPGTDQISKAFSDAWVGTKGYKKPDGTWQRARGFLGNVRDKKDRKITEVFIVDIPERIDVAGRFGPLEGTKSTMPMPPSGTKQRRLTFTTDRKYPGVVTEPRHWVRSSPDGKWINYLAKDSDGIIQIFFVSPNGGEPEQVTHHKTPIQSTVRWGPAGDKVCYVCDNSIFICNVKEGKDFGNSRRVTPRTEKAPICPVFSQNGKMIAYNRLVRNGRKSYKQIFILELE